MRQEVIETIAEAFPFVRGQITGSTPLREIVRDSIDAVELVAVLSSTYGIRVEPEDFAGMHTVADVVEYVARSAGSERRRQPLELF